MFWSVSFVAMCIFSVKTAYLVNLTTTGRVLLDEIKRHIYGPRPFIWACHQVSMTFRSKALARTSSQGCICKFEKVREIPHLIQKTAGFWNFCAGFSVWPKIQYFQYIHQFYLFLFKGIITRWSVSTHFRIFWWAPEARLILALPKLTFKLT